MDFTDPQHGWLVGMLFSNSSSLLLRTQDGGATWALAADAFKDEMLSGVDFIDEDHGWVAGQDVWSTEDGGATWTREVADFGQGSSIAAVDAAHVWVAADGYGIVSTVDATGDTAPPTTTSVGARGWVRADTSIALAADDAGGTGVESTEYRLDDGAWRAYALPLEFPAPADHSGDGRHLLEYRSTDKAGLVESLQSCRVDIDTIRPVIRLRPSKIGRDGVLRLRGRIDDASCPSISEFRLVFRDRRGRKITTAEFSGFTWPMNRWFTFRNKDFTVYDGSPGVYRVSLYAVDRAGNTPVAAGSTRLVVKRRPHRRAAAPVVRELFRSARHAGGYHGPATVSRATRTTAPPPLPRGCLTRCVRRWSGWPSGWTELAGAGGGAAPPPALMSLHRPEARGLEPPGCVAVAAEQLAVALIAAARDRRPPRRLGARRSRARARACSPGSGSRRRASRTR